MFAQISEMLYLYIMRCEVFLLRTYKVNPFEVMRGMSLLDLNTYMTMIQKEEEKEQKDMKHEKITECLRHINDYLNLMFFKK